MGDKQPVRNSLTRVVGAVTVVAESGETTVLLDGTHTHLTFDQVDALIQALRMAVAFARGEAG